MAARKPPAKPPAPTEADDRPSAVPAPETSAAAPLEPPAVPADSTEPDAGGTPTGITFQPPAPAADTELVDEHGALLPRDLGELFDLTHPEWTVVFPKVRIYQRRAIPGSRRTVTHLLYVPAQSIPRAEFDRLRLALDWE